MKSDLQTRTPRPVAELEHEALTLDQLFRLARKPWKDVADLHRRAIGEGIPVSERTLRSWLHEPKVRVNGANREVCLALLQFVDVPSEAIERFFTEAHGTALPYRTAGPEPVALAADLYPERVIEALDDLVGRLEAVVLQEEANLVHAILELRRFFLEWDGIRSDLADALRAGSPAQIARIQHLRDDTMALCGEVLRRALPEDIARRLGLYEYQALLRAAVREVMGSTDPAYRGAEPVLGVMGQVGLSRGDADEDQLRESEEIAAGLLARAQALADATPERGRRRLRGLVSKVLPRPRGD